MKVNDEFKLHQELAEKALQANPIACEMIYNSNVDTSKFEFKDAKILVMQAAKYSNLTSAEQQLDEIIKNDASGRLPDFIIYPEFYVAENGSPTHNHAGNFPPIFPFLETGLIVCRFSEPIQIDRQEIQLLHRHGYFGGNSR